MTMKPRGASGPRAATPRDASDAAARRRRVIVSVIIGSLVIHLIGGIIAGIWIVARYFEKPKAQFTVEKRITIDPEERVNRMNTEQVESLRPKPVFDQRITSLRPTALALPELPKLPVDLAVPLDTDALVSDQIDSVSVGRSGQGSGTGGFFGGSGKAGSGLLEGTFYDLKQTPDGKPKPITDQEWSEVIKRFARGWNDAVFSKYYRAPGKLYATRILMPVMAADNAPREFSVSDKVQPSRWVVHYKGRIKAPDSGRYRFVGIADDVLLVRFNRNFVLDGSFTGERSMDSARRYVYVNCFGEPRLQETYRNMGGHAVGKAFEVTKGNSYDIEILVGEGPGIDFYAFLQIEKMTPAAAHAKDADGSPILPLFQMVDQPVPQELKSRMPPFAPVPEFWQPSPQSVSGFGMESP